MKKALIAGGAGYIGFEVSKMLRELDYGVYVLDKDDARLPAVLRFGGKFLKDDVMSAAGLVQRYDVIVNLVGGLDDAHLYWNDQEFAKQVAAPWLLRKLSSDARLIHVSTQFVYSGEELHKEREKEEPVTDYGRLHLMAEQALRNDSNAVVLRCGTVWGRTAYTRWDTWGNHLLSAKDAGKAIDIYHPNAMMCLLSMNNMLRVVEWAIGAEPGIYNVADRIDYREALAKHILGDYLFTVRKSDTLDISVGMECSRILKAKFEFVED